MKKILSLLLVVFMVVLLVGCGTGVSNNGNVTNETDASETEASTENGTVKAQISKGTIEGDVYKNEYLGFKFTKPASWVYSTDEEIAAAMNVAVDKILGDKYKETLESNPATYDMMVVDSLTGSNINIVYENLKLSFATNITIEQYVEALKQQLSGVSGMTVSFSDKLEKVKLGETEFTKCVCETSFNGVSMTQVFYLCKVDGYMVAMTATITGGYTVAEIEAMFQ